MNFIFSDTASQFLRFQITDHKTGDPLEVITATR